MNPRRLCICAGLSISRALWAAVLTAAVAAWLSATATPAAGQSPERSAEHAESGEHHHEHFDIGDHEAPRHEDVRDATGIAKFFAWLGKLHPAATDLPIGMSIGAALGVLLLVFTRREVFAPITRYCIWVASLATVGTGALGWLFLGFHWSDGQWVITTHRWLGTSATIWMIATVAVVEYSRHGQGRRGWRVLGWWMILLGALLLATTAFFGGAMIYGLDHYAWSGT